MAAALGAPLDPPSRSDQFHIEPLTMYKPSSSLFADKLDFIYFTAQNLVQVYLPINLSLLTLLHQTILISDIKVEVC